MILLPFASNETYGVLGLGKSGRATVASLIASGARVVAWDDGEAGRAAAAKEFPSMVVKPVVEWDFTGLAALVVSPGIFLTHPAVVAANAAGVEVIGDIELLYRAQPSARYVCITGTNGKSTSTTLIAHILKACGKRVEVGGNLGTPALALAPLGEESSGACHPRESGDPAEKNPGSPMKLPDQTQGRLEAANSGMTGEEAGIYVLELSSYQLDLVRTTKFDVSVLLNISPDHLDHHGSMENYIAAKMRIFERMTAADVAIVGVDDGESTRIAERLAPMRVVRISGVPSLRAERRNPAKEKTGLLRRFLGLCATDSLCAPRNDGAFNVADIRNVKSLQGAHNHQNAAAAYAAASACGCAHDEIIAAMQSYPGLAHRMQWLGEIAGVAYVNDSKATNADAAEKALLTYDRIHWIIGGVAKEGGIAPLAKYFPKIRHAYLIGEAAADFARTLEGKVHFTHCGTLDKAFAAASAAARDGETVVLSPACASFDQYPNFEVRGAAFVELFEQYKVERGK